MKRGKVVSASIIGKSHQRLLYNNQDAYKVHQEEGLVVAVVCDGCGSLPASEVGSRLTAEFVVNYCVKYFRSTPFNGPALVSALCEFYRDCAAKLLVTDLSLFIKEHFYTTVIGGIFSETQNIIFSSGDGIIVVDSRVENINQNNAPQYLAYNITHHEQYGFTVRNFSGENFSRILIATDGLEDLWKEGESTTLIEELFSEKYFSSEIELSKFLSVQDNLYDDTTVVMIAF